VKAAGLFSGGKDSFYSVYLTEKEGYDVEYMVSLITSFSRPSPHVENIGALRQLAEPMGKRHVIVDLRKGKEELVKTLRDLGVDALVAGDILLESHLRWMEGICDQAGLTLIEPLFGRDTTEVFWDIVEAGFKYVIVGVKKEAMGEEWLGFTVSGENAEDFLSSIGDVDPVGENGEYHTIVVDCPLYDSPHRVTSKERHTGEDMSHIVIGLSREDP